MRPPRFKLRSLLALVVFAGPMLAVAVLSVQNHRLRVENARLQATQPRLVALDLALSLEDVVVTGQIQPSVKVVPLATWRPAHPLSVPQADPAGTMPTGPDAFAK
jgi:hypothetical protein